jgi:hypothetical protein
MTHPVLAVGRRHHRAERIRLAPSAHAARLEASHRLAVKLPPIAVYQWGAIPDRGGIG